MLADASTIASLVGVAVSLGGFGLAIWQIMRLRGETRAARQAAEETRRSIGRDLAIADASRISEWIQPLKEVHRARDWGQALFLYREMRRGLRRISSLYPNLTDTDAQRIQTGIARLRSMEQDVEGAGDNIPHQRVRDFDGYLTEIQDVLEELESRLPQSS